MTVLNLPPAIAKIAPDGNLTVRQRRRIMIEMCLRRQKPGSGSAIEFLRRRTAVNSWLDLRDILKGIKWLIVGGVATRAYMPERMTKDIDVLVHHFDGEETIERLTKAGYKIVSKLAVPGYLLRSPEEVELDVIFGNYPWLKQALENPEYDMANYPVLSLPYLVLMKINASRSQDWTDVSRMLGLATEDQLNRVREVIRQYSPEDMDDLESLIVMGQLEMKLPPDSI